MFCLCGRHFPGKCGIHGMHKLRLWKVFGSLVFNVRALHGGYILDDRGVHFLLSLYRWLFPASGRFDWLLRVPVRQLLRVDIALGGDRCV